MSARIGISIGLDDRGRWRAGRDYHYVDAGYARAVEAAGGRAVYLHESTDAASALDGIDGLLIPGGDDFLPPAPYPADVSFEAAPPRQLHADRALLAAALDRDAPVLGICYGMQLLALEHGCTLHYDLGHDLPGAGSHSGGARHAIRVEPDSALADVTGSDLQDVNCWHHQAVAEVAPPLRATAWSGDGVVEAIEHPARRFCIGVQWHPERLDSDASARLFAAFVRAATR